MNKRLSLPAYSLMLALFLTACREQELDHSPGVLSADETFYATLEGNDDSGTRIYADDQLHVLWDADDRISLFARSTSNRPYRFMGETGDKEGLFEPVPFSGTYGETLVSDVYAVYPYRESTSLRGGVGMDCILTVELPARQTYREGTFGLSANLMVAVTRNTDLYFRNAASYLVLKLYGSGFDVESITLKGNEGEPLAGKADVSMKRGGKPTVSVIPGGYDKIELVCEQPVKLGATAKEATEFWLAVPPRTFKQGFTVKVSGKGGKTFKHYTDRAVTLERNRRVSMAPIDVNGNGPGFI